MFDDVLSATALIGVASVFAAAAASLVSTPDPKSAATAKTTTASSHDAGSAPSKGSSRVIGAMPVYELPRVVVTGQRQRDGDMLADGTTTGRGGAVAAPTR